MKNILNRFVIFVSIAVIVSTCKNTGHLDESSDNSTSTSDNSSSANPEVFVATGNNGDILRSTDNGSSWDNGTISVGELQIYDVAFGNGVFIITSQGGLILRSTDNGSTWDNMTQYDTNLPNITAVGISN